MFSLTEKVSSKELGIGWNLSSICLIATNGSYILRLQVLRAAPGTTIDLDWFMEDSVLNSCEVEAKLDKTNMQKKCKLFKVYNIIERIS